MRQRNIFKIIVAALLFQGCHGKTDVKIRNAQSIPDDTNSKVTIPTTQADLKVSAHLVYDDGSLSSFDVLNDKSKALWNVIIGAGDAEKPSTRTKIRMAGQLDGLRVKIFNGNRKVEDKDLPNVTGAFDIVVEETGCEVVRLYITRKSAAVYSDSIEFHCGE